MSSGDILMAATSAAAAATAAASATSPGGPTLLPNFAGSLLNSLYNQAHFLTVGVFDKYGDPRVSNYHLMRTPWPTIGATLLYYWFVRIAGPRMMRNRKPYQILPLIRVYNLMMAAWNGIGFLTACHLVGYGVELLGCRPIDPFQRDDKTLNQIYYGWMFYTSRLVEFADTIFFVLRKKENQVSSFHVFHHSCVPTVVWFFMKFAPGGNSGIFPYINTIIHTVMYTYYFLATFPSMQPYLWWKKYLTQMQIVQFIIIIAICMQPMFIPGCKVSKVLLTIVVALSFVFIYLFVDFYLKAYKRTKSALKKKLIEQGEQQAALMQKVLKKKDGFENSAQNQTKLMTSSLEDANGIDKKHQ